MRTAQVWGVGALGGIGFTVALFITDLAFTNELLTGEAKIGIFLGSIVSGVLGALLLYRMRDRER
jgi:NhaA family Na+:H+ antiporter